MVKRHLLPADKEDVVREIFQRLVKAVDDAVEDEPVHFFRLTAADYWATDRQRVATQNVSLFRVIGSASKC